MTESAKFVDYYELLEVATDAEPQQIRAAYLRLAKQHHPDVGGATTDMQQYNTAYRTLISASSRRAYDLQYDFQKGVSAVHYRDDGSTVKGSKLDDLSDTEIDDFIDSVYAEYKAQPKPKETLLTKLRKLL